MGDIVNESMHRVMSEGGLEDQPWLRAVELSLLCCLPMAMSTLIQLKVFDVMAHADTEKGGTTERGLYSAEEIASRMSSVLPDARTRVSVALDRILRVVASHGVVHANVDRDPFTKHPTRRYGLNLVSQYFVQNESSLAPLLCLSVDPVTIKSWHVLHEAILDDGQPFSKAHNGLDLFEYGQLDPHFGSTFNFAMTSYCALPIRYLLESYPTCFDDVNILVDVGGGHGSSLHSIISHFPHIRGINFDQPHVISLAPHYSGTQLWQASHLLYDLMNFKFWRGIHDK